MSLAALIRSMAEAGAPAEAIALAVEAVEGEAAKLAAIREAARLKKQRQREAAKGDKAGTVPGQGGDTAGTVRDTPPSPALSPQTPLTHPHPPGVCTTRTDAREDAGFARFWDAYPRKTAKAAARKAFHTAWRKLPPMDEEQILVGGLERAKAGWTEAQFIPHAATWLNGERWNDEPFTITPIRDHGRPHTDQRQTARQDRLGRSIAGLMAAVDEREPELDRSCDGTRGRH